MTPAFYSSNITNLVMAPSRSAVRWALVVACVLFGLSRNPPQEMSHGRVLQEERLRYYCNGEVSVSADEIEVGCASNVTVRPMEMGVVVQLYNHADQAEGVVRGLVNQKPVRRILVTDDGSTDGSMEAYRKALNASARRNQNIITNVIRTPNVHEIRNYNRGMELMMKENPSIELFALMQDDDVLQDDENNDRWAERAVELFQRFPRLCVLGGYIGFEHIHNGLLRGFEYHGNEKSYNHKPSIEISQNCSGLQFQFVMSVASSPMILRKQCVQDIGLLSEMYTQPGDPGILFDVEYSLRAWASRSWQVGIYRTEFHHGVGGHGTLSSREKRKQRQAANVKGQKWIREQHRGGGHLHCYYRPRLDREHRQQIMSEYRQNKNQPQQHLATAVPKPNNNQTQSKQ